MNLYLPYSYTANQILKRIAACIFVFSFVAAHQALAQLQVDDRISIQAAINKLVGQGVRVSNIRVECPSGKSSPYGYFTDNTGTLGITDGLIMTTGAAKNAVGPNNSGSAGQSNGNKKQDTDLASLSRTTEKQFDACVVLFDVEVFADTLTFDYVFGSEEYLEFIKDYHDIFGFFISGPGIPGKVNLATVPGTRIPISVKNVNNGTNSQFYVDNGTGATPFENLFVQYDGFTKRLESKIAVIPCQQYTIKLAICDMKDDIYDAGIFIAGKSLKTKAPKITTRYQFNNFATAIEGCNGVFVKITRQSQLQTAVTFQLEYGGTATRDIDYTPVPDQVSFLPGDSVQEFFVAFPADVDADDNESLTIQLLNPCPGLPPTDQISVPIRETFDFDLPDDSLCAGESVVLNPEPGAGFGYFWSPPDFLSCTACPSPTSKPPTNQTYFVTTTHTASGCQAKDTLSLFVAPVPVAGFSFESRPDFTNLDVFFKNTSAFADAWSWTFGDGGSSASFEPRHYYESGFATDSAEYQIVLEAKNARLGCADTATASVKIGNPLFIPNLITANDDEVNDAFFVRGIQPGYWKFQVFNRWGKSVFETDRYDLNWKANDVTAGVYYFVLRNPGGEHIFNGWIQVVK